MKLKRKFEVREVTQPHDTIERKFNKKKMQFEDVKRTIPGGFIVAFPQGHSTFFETREQMHEAGIIEEDAIVDMETGVRVPKEMAAQYDHSLHDLIEGNGRMVGRSGRHNATVDQVIDAGE